MSSIANRPYKIGFPAIAIAVASLFVSARAQAADAGVDEATALFTQVQNEGTALQTQDCATACKALASILRATDRLCALDPGPRCLQARATADDAAARVRAACPECAMASVTEPPKPVRERENGKGGSAPPPEADTASVPAEKERGGCASCNTTSTRAEDAGDALTMLVIAGLVFARRKKR